MRRFVFTSFCLFVAFNILFSQEPPVPEVALKTSEITLQKRISISGANIPLISIVELIAEETGLSYYLDQGLSQLAVAKIDFKEEPAKNILDFLQDNYDFVYKIDGSRIVLKKYDTWVFEIGLPARSYKSSVNIGGSVIPSGTLAGSADVKSEYSSGQLDIYTALEGDIKNLLTEGGKYSLNRNAGILIVSDSARALKRIKAFVDKIKSVKDKKVRIEAKIMEVSLDDANSYGIDWNLLKTFSLNSTPYTINVSQNTSLNQQAFSLDLRGGGFTAFVNFLSTFGKVNIVSQPTISLINGETALLSVGRLLTYWELTAQSAGAQVGTPVVYPVQKNILKGLLFSVTPIVYGDSVITMEITPVLADVSKWETYTWQGQTLQAPDVDIKEAHTVMKVKAGETVVMGGLITQKENKVERGIPFLSKIPVLSHLFKRQEITRERQELVILLTPVIE